MPIVNPSDLERKNDGTITQTRVGEVEISLENPTQRCGWGDSDPLYISYHDQEWGVPVHDSQDLFAKLILDGAQAGLSWITILRKREAYYRAFDGLDPVKIALYDESKVVGLLQDQGIVRNRLKVESAIANARAYLDMEGQGIRFSQFLWEFVDGRTKQNSWGHLKQVPPKTRESEAMSRALREKGFRFVGPTICYAFMQAVGMVNDHVVGCFRHQELGGSS
jgi:DNA-3-methyladenine glycosylase I